MRFMVLVKADEQAGAPGEEQVRALTRYTKDLVRAGVLLAADGLTSSADGTRVCFADGRATVVDGPFEGALVTGYWVLDVGSKQEALEWVRRCPRVGTGEFELRQVAEPAEAPGPELREHEDYLRAQIGARRT
ncbi:YciI family protein [Actinophytocola sp.]|uniref:YciI family protein n=1 Tax=Actinophytocola sp. TaxID=1872138 RepID=UPI002EDB82D1